MPKARCPAERPMAHTTNQFSLVRASSITVVPMMVPCALAELKPKVGVDSGNGRSLSMVLGTWMLAMG